MAAVGGAGIPQGSLVTITVVLTAVGLPLESVSLVLAVDWIMYEQLFFCPRYTSVAEENFLTSESASCLRVGIASGPSSTCWPTASVWVWCTTCAEMTFRRPVLQKNAPFKEIISFYLSSRTSAPRSNYSNCTLI